MRATRLKSSSSLAPEFVPLFRVVWTASAIPPPLILTLTTPPCPLRVYFCLEHLHDSCTHYVQQSCMFINCTFGFPRSSSESITHTQLNSSFAGKHGVVDE